MYYCEDLCLFVGCDIEVCGVLIVLVDLVV